MKAYNMQFKMLSLDLSFYQPMQVWRIFEKWIIIKKIQQRQNICVNIYAIYKNAIYVQLKLACKAASKFLQSN